MPKGLDSARICFTCHNFEYQGLAPASELASCGLDVHQLNRPDRMQDHKAHDRVNPVKVTRSPYAPPKSYKAFYICPVNRGMVPYGREPLILFCILSRSGW